MSTTVEALKSQAHHADEIIRMAMGVARRYELVKHLHQPVEEPAVVLDLDEVKQLAEHSYDN